MTFSPDEIAAIEGWKKRACPLAGVFYRSVEYRFMDPREVLSGMGTQRYGGRFATVGTRAVYLAGSDETASREVLARKKRLRDTSQITLAKYPRVVFAVSVTLQKVLTWLRRPRSKALMKVRESCLSLDDLARSQELGQLLLAAGVHHLPHAFKRGQPKVPRDANCFQELRQIEREGLRPTLKLGGLLVLQFP